MIGSMPEYIKSKYFVNGRLSKEAPPELLEEYETIQGAFTEMETAPEFISLTADDFK